MTEAQLPVAADRPGRRGRGRAVALLAVSVAVAILLAEVVVRVVAPDQNPSPEWHYDPQLGWVQNPGHRYTYTVDGEPVEVAYNSSGYRDVEHARRKHPSVKRAVVIGDSFCAAVEVNLRDTFARRLEKILNARTADDWEVVNLGVGDFGTAQEYLALEHVGLAYQPDVVVHQIFPLNDICNNSIELAGLCKSRKDSYRPYFVIVGEGDLRLTSTQPALDFLRRHLRLERLVERAYFRIAGREESQVDNDDYDRLVAEAGLPPLAPLLYTYVDSEEQIEPVARGWQVTERLIEQIAGRCRRLGIAYLPVVIPFHARVGEIWSGFAASQPPPAMIQDYPERRFGDLFARLGVSGVMMKEVFEENPEQFFPPRGGHLNPAAHALVAQALYQELLRSGLATEDLATLRGLAPELGTDLVAGGFYLWGTPIELVGDRATGLLGDGWGRPEGTYRWTVGDRAAILLSAPLIDGPVLLQAKLHALLVPGKVERQRVRVLVNSEAVGEWSIAVAGFHDEVLPIFVDRLGGSEKIELVFETPDAASPAALGMSRDERTLAVAFESVTLGGLEGRKK